VVGTGTTTSFGSSPLPLIWTSGVASQLPLPSGQTLARANDVNGSHVAVGSANSGSSEVACYYSGGTGTVITTLTSTGCFFRTAFGISEAGTIVGFGVDPANAARNVGFIYDLSTDASTEVGALAGMNGAICYDISPTGGLICGASMLGQGSALPFVYIPGSGMLPIPLPPSTSSGSSRGVNSAGQVVGNAGGQYSVPWLWDSGATYTIQSLLPPGSGWDLSTNTSASALGISETGTIVGTGVHNGQTHGYALVPDLPTAVQLQRFAAVEVPTGVKLSWSFADPSDIASVAVESAPESQGPWTTLGGVITTDGESMSTIDDAIGPGDTRFYRLAVIERSGAASTMGLTSATRGAVTGRLALERPSPSPAREGASVAFTLPSAAHAQLAIYDVRGRLVRTLLDSSLPAGRQVVAWDGRGGDGQAEPSGVYFVRLQTREGTISRRLSLIR
jgi:hypothetical protein